MTEADLSNKNLGAAGAMIVGAWISHKDNGALTILNVSNNTMKGAEAGKAFAAALAENTVLKELDLSGGLEDGTWGDPVPNIDVGFSKEFAVGLSANGALVSVNILNNDIGVEQAQNLAAILEAHVALRSLCGNKGGETVLDMSGKNMGADGVIMLVPEIVANGALEILLMANNQIKGADAGKALGDMLARNTVLKELDLSNQGNGNSHTMLDSVCAKELGVGLGANGAMTSLNISNNKLGEMVLINGITYAAAKTGKMLYWDKDDKSLGPEPPPGCGPVGVIALADAIKTNGALACEDGKYYHEWQLDPRYKALNDAVDQGINDNKEEMLAQLKQLEEMGGGEEKQKVLQEMGVTNVPSEEEFISIVKQMVFDAQRIEEGVFKFKSTAPDIEGQEDDPGVPLANSICQHCGQPKDRHHAKGALASLDLSQNFIPESEANQIKTSCQSQGISLEI
eukprot:g2068.t1